MFFVEENDYGCTKFDGISDMTAGEAGTITDQLDKAEKPYQRTALNMGTIFADTAYLIHYRAKSNIAITVLVVPQVGADSWAENYYHFPGMTADDAAQLNWCEVYAHVSRVHMETITSKIPVATKCPNCGKLDGVDGGGWYEDIRGRKRCKFCHNLKGN